MNLILLTSSALHENRGPQARLKVELDSLSTLNNITVICMGAEPDNAQTKIQFHQVTFLHSPIIYDGWNVLNVRDIFEFTLKVVKSQDIDLVVLQMEIWDLIREFSLHALGKFTFTTVFHAMPFLTSPMNPTGNFEQDVLEYSNTGIEEYRKEYILSHYKEAEQVLTNTMIIANNLTVNYYLNKYFNNLNIWIQSPFAIANALISRNLIKRKYDFVYMARIEKGKGLEYFKEILKEAAQLLNRPVSIAIMGKPEDAFSKKVLTDLQFNQRDDYTVDYLGWADSDQKRQAFIESGVFLYPSHNDNYPTVTLEALAHGLPVVLWETPYSKINYANTPAVKLVRYNNIVEFAKAAVETLTNKDSLSQEATRFINSFHDSDTIASKDTELFQNITLYAKSSK